ncbi:zinc-ribbon domain-containing protein [Streptosporangium sp. NPDC004379]|uniref:zinc-ribbon domain-containing protein n=1 Tax=Streptosporangium sp. NPDC004379 TaxID=3366189 RepID=UPI0036A4ADF3
MLFIFGLRTVVQRLGMITLVCRNCGNTAAQALAKRVTKFSLFFIPIFPVRTRHVMQCTYCGAAYDVSRDEMKRLRSGVGPARLGGF